MALEVVFRPVAAGVAAIVEHVPCRVREDPRCVLELNVNGQCVGRPPVTETLGPPDPCGGGEVWAPAHGGVRGWVRRSLAWRGLRFRLTKEVGVWFPHGQPDTAQICCF